MLFGNADSLYGNTGSVFFIEQISFAFCAYNLDSVTVIRCEKVVCSWTLVLIILILFYRVSE